MPLPIGHALAGLSCAQVRCGFFFRNRWHDAFFFMFLANLPDMDFLPGFIQGRPNLYHHGIFHSLGAALAVAALGACFFSRARHRFWSRAVAIFLVFGSHLLLDFFTRDFVAPFGMPLLWPLTGRYFIASHPVFINITRSGRADDFFISLFNRHNLAAAGREILLLGGALAAVVLVRHLLKKKDH